MRSRFFFHFIRISYNQFYLKTFTRNCTKLSKIFKFRKHLCGFIFSSCNEWIPECDDCGVPFLSCSFKCVNNFPVVICIFIAWVCNNQSPFNERRSKEVCCLIGIIFMDFRLNSCFCKAFCNMKGHAHIVYETF